MAEEKTAKPAENKPAENKPAERPQQRRPETSDAQRESWITTSAAHDNSDEERNLEQATAAGAEGMQRATGAVAGAARRGGRIGAENLQQTGAATGQTVRSTSEAFAEAQGRFMEETARQIEEVGRRVADAVQSSTEDLRLWFSYPSTARTNVQEFQQGIQTLVEGMVRTNVQAMQQILQIVDPGAVLDLNRRIFRDYMSVFMHGTAGITRAMHRAADEGLRPIEEQLEHRAGGSREQGAGSRGQRGGNGQQQQRNGDQNAPPVAEVMERNVRIAKPDDTVQEAARLMREEDTGILPVGEGDRLVGMVTDRDVAVRLVAEGRDPAQTKVRDVMTPEVRYVFEDEPLERVAENMAEQQVRRMPVVNRSKRLVGMVSIGDLARHGSEHETSRAYAGIAA